MQIRVLSFALLALGATAAQANLITNGSFEDVSLNGSWSQFNTITGWYAMSDKIEIGQAGVYGVTGQDGANVLELDANHNATVAQDLSLSAGTYSLSFLKAMRAGTDPSTNEIQVLWNGTQVASYLPNSTAFSMESLNLTAVGGVNTLAFRSAGSADSYGGMVDKVSVQAVPEPASVAALGVGAMGLLRRRRKA